MEPAEILDRLISAVFPQRCASCDRVVAYEDFWCERCGEEELPAPKPCRPECGFPHGFFDALAAFEYRGRTRELVWRLKKHADRRILRWLAEPMCAAMEEHWQAFRPDLIVPVPAAASQRKARGFNHAEKLASHVSALTGIPMQRDILIRHEDTQVQHSLAAAQRRANAEQSYAIGRPERLAGKTVLLIDDVFTTGATAAACADRLLEAGAGRVAVLTATYQPYQA